MKVCVTQQDIEQGVPHSNSACALSLAISRAAGSLWRVGTNIAWPSDDMTSHGASLPEAAREFRRKFDAEVPVSPFEFDLEVHDDLVGSSPH